MVCFAKWDVRYASNIGSHCASKYTLNMQRSHVARQNGDVGFCEFQPFWMFRTWGGDGSDCRAASWSLTQSTQRLTRFQENNGIVMNPSVMWTCGSSEAWSLSAQVWCVSASGAWRRKINVGRACKSLKKLCQQPDSRVTHTHADRNTHLIDGTKGYLGICVPRRSHELFTSVVLSCSKLLVPSLLCHYALVLLVLGVLGTGFSVANVANAAGASCDGSVCEVMSSDQSDQFSDIESIKGPTGREEELEELHVGMLQVSAGLLPRESTIEASELRKNTKKDVVHKVHESIFQWIEGDSIKSMLLPIATAILLPHAVSFLVAHAIMHKNAEHSTESEVLQEKQEEPKSFAYIAERIGPMWLIHMLGIFSFALGAPSIEYLYLNYFARQQSHSQIDCSVQMAEAPCAQSIMKVLHLAIIRGFALPFVQFIVGPALGAFSDAYGRRPAVLVIRTCLFIHCAGTAAVAWFPIPIWIDFGLSFFAMIPWGSVPFAWYIDRLDHAPSIVYAMSMVEGSCIICAALGTAIGSFLTLKMALLVEFLGRGVTTMLIAIFLLPESLPEEKRVPFSWSSLTPTAALQLLLQSPVVEKLTAIGVINAFHWAGYYTLFGRFLQSHMAWTRQNTYTGGLVEQVSQVLWLFLGVKVLLRIFGQAGLMAVSTTAAVLSNILQMLSNKPWQIYTNSVVLSGPAIMGSAVVAGIVGKAASGGQQGMLQTALGLVTQMAGALGPVAFATVYKLLDPTAPGAPAWNMYLYILYGALFAVPSLLLTFSLSKHDEKVWAQQKKNACRSSCSLPGGLVLIWDPWATIATQRTKHIIRYYKYNLITDEYLLVLHIAIIIWNDTKRH